MKKTSKTAVRTADWRADTRDRMRALILEADPRMVVEPN